jgi:hypothetical protein
MTNLTIHILGFILISMVTTSKVDDVAINLKYAILYLEDDVLESLELSGADIRKYLTENNDSYDVEMGNSNLTL